MIDTPFSIMDNRNPSATQVYVFAPAKPLILPSGVIAWGNWQQQTETGQILPSDTIHYQIKTDVLGAIATNPDWIGNVSED